MHVQHSVHIHQPVKQLSDAMLDDPAKWFPKSVGVHVAGIPVRKKVSEETRLTVSGMYEPPLSRLGERLDEALMHNIAEGTVKELAEVIGERLKKAVGAG